MNARFSSIALAMTALGLLWTTRETCARPAPLLAGVSFSGAEINAGKPGARAGFDYVYPSAAEIGWAAGHGMTAIRLPVLWERLQPRLDGPLDPAELARVSGVVALAKARGMSVILDLHDYGAYQGREVGTATPDAAFADLWRRLAGYARSQPTLILGLMNEPHTMKPAQWRASAETGLRAVRAAGARNLVLVSGADWDGAHSWTSGGGASNAAAMNSLADPSGPIAFEMHQYFDSDSSGTHPDCVPPARAVASLEPAPAWLEHGHRHGFLGEFGAAASPGCLATLNAVLGFLDRHRDAWIGWTYWAAGPWWGNYMFSVEPASGRERPQMAILQRHLPAPGITR